MDNSTTPEAAAFDVSASRRVWNGRVVVECSSHLSIIFAAVLGRVCPWLVVFSSVILKASERVISFWAAIERSWCTVPFGICGGLDLHVGVDRTFHVSLFCRALVVLVALAKLSTGIADGIDTIDKVPAVFVTCIVLDGLLHTLSKESSNVDKSILVTVGSIVTHEEVLVCNSIVVHNTKSSK